MFSDHPNIHEVPEVPLTYIVELPKDKYSCREAAIKMALLINEVDSRYPGRTVRQTNSGYRFIDGELIRSQVTLQVI